MSERARFSRNVYRFCFIVTALLAVSSIRSAAHAQVEESNWIMFRDPALPPPELIIRFPEGLVDLWVDALKRPEREMKRRAAAAIAQARKRNVPGLEATMVPLMEILNDPEQDRIVRLTAATALIALDVRQCAPMLLKQLTEGDLDTAEAIEPALARWAYDGALSLWRERLAADNVFRRARILAIQGLVALNDTDSIPPLVKLALDRRGHASLRLAAAEGIGQLQKSGGEQTVRSLIGDKSPTALVDRLVGAKMLASHSGKEAEKLLAELAIDPVSSVRTVALERLFQIDPKLVLPLVEPSLDCADVNVRRIATEALLVEATPENVVTVSAVLDDPNPALRRHVRDFLIKLAAKDTLHDVVIRESRRVLNQDGWRGQEQATRLLVALDDKTIVDRLVVLLESQRPETHMTAAWGLCQLNVPRTIDAIFSTFEKKTNLCLNKKPTLPGTQTQLCFLAHAIGRMKYMPADPVLRKYIPKDSPFAVTARASSIWALGHLYSDKKDDHLAELLRKRLTDLSPTNPEDPLVRRFAGISLGRMKAEKTLPSLRTRADLDGIHSAIGIGCYWAIHQITGEPIPKVPPAIFWDKDWFLIPYTAPPPTKKAPTDKE